MQTAGRPTFFKSFKSKERPALVKMIINAILRKSEDMFSRELSIMFKKYGPRMIPVKIIPVRLGKWIFLHIHPVNIPINTIIAILISIIKILLFSQLDAKKADNFCVKNCRSHQLLLAVLVL